MARHILQRPILCQSLRVLIVSQLLTFTQLAFAAQKPLYLRDKSPFDTYFDGLVSEVLDRWHTPGVAIAVIDGNQTFSKSDESRVGTSSIFSYFAFVDDYQGYGFEQLPDKPVTPSTLFYTGSTTKSFTAAAISLLIDDTANSSEPLTWQTPLVDYLREDFVMNDDYLTTHITLEDAASHRTGQPGYDFAWSFTDDSLREVVRKFRYLPPTAEIRTKWQYCNMMFMALSYFIEEITGSWLGDFLRSRIYEPLNLNATFFALSDAKAAVDAGQVSLAEGYTWNNFTRSYRPFPYVDQASVSGAGATISNVLDYAKWLRCLMTMSSPLTMAGHSEMRRPRIERAPIAEDAGFADFDFYALGLFSSFYRGELMIWHTGGMPGFGTIMAFLPDKQWGVVSMANTVEGGSTVNRILAFELIDELLSIPESERYDWGQKTEETLANGSLALRHARQTLYPEAPEPPLAHILPLSEYAGRYSHPALPSLNLTLNKASADAGSEIDSSVEPYLQTRFPHHFNSVYISLEHISGEYFLARFRYLTDEAPQAGDYDPWVDEVGKAEFHIGEDGKVLGLGLAIEPEMGETKIWWQRQH